ncbi:MAG: hypothetical protein WC076_09800 [Terrimicrobiaceae bacterium]
MLPLGSVCEDIFQGVTIKPGDSEDPIVLKVKNIRGDEGIDFSDVEHARDVPERKHLRSGDLISPFIGEAIRQINFAIFHETKGQYTVDGNTGVIRPHAAKVSAEYLQNWFQSSFGRLQILRLIGGGGVPFLGAHNVAKLVVAAPPLRTQRELVAAMDAARAERRVKLAEADALLAGLDGFLLATLGLTPPPKDDRKVFAATLASVRGRADADFHSPRFRSIREGIEAGKYPARSLAQLCSRFESGFAAGRQDQAFDYTLGVPHLRPLNLNAQGEISLENTKFVPKNSVQPRDYCELGEVLFNNTNSAEMVGKSTVFEFEQPCACSNHMTRLRVREGNSAHYLAAIFNMLRRLGYLGLLATKFNNQAGINLDTLTPLRVPAPPPAVQERIATEARRRREAARRLRAEAETGWQAAKRWFEEQLLGGVK